ncbi:unnamed protein product [Wuchereria bancrofti]|uniref:Uncharacterized protein n=1 Tax=Wuchereria bancrofti TaxID=6293 RepID=A0A3P7E3R9_WUCBA|nr:unnamed protein product [Wuchereria bancrofti]
MVINKDNIFITNITIDTTEALNASPLLSTKVHIVKAPTDLKWIVMELFCEKEQKESNHDANHRNSNSISLICRWIEIIGLSAQTKTITFIREELLMDAMFLAQLERSRTGE